MLIRKIAIAKILKIALSIWLLKVKFIKKNYVNKIKVCLFSIKVFEKEAQFPKIPLKEVVRSKSCQNQFTVKTIFFEEWKKYFKKIRQIPLFILLDVFAFLYSYSYCHIASHTNLSIRQLMLVGYFGVCISLWL